MDETNLVTRNPKQKGKPKDKSSTKKSGGTFTVTDDFTLTNVNVSGSKDLEIVYALYPECGHSVKQLAIAIQQQDDPNMSIANIDSERAQALLTSRIQRYHSDAFSRLTTDQKKTVLSAIDRAIHYRQKEHITITQAQQEGKGTVALIADAKGHLAWIHNLKVFRAHALRKARQEKGIAITRTRKLVREEIYQYIENIPTDFPQWDNWQERLLRVLFEGYYVQCAIKTHPKDKVYHSIFPRIATKATISEDSVLSLPVFQKAPAELCLYETIFTMRSTNFVCVSTLPTRVKQNAEVRNILKAMIGTRFPTPFTPARKSVRKSKIFISNKPITIGRKQFSKHKTQKKRTKSKKRQRS